MKKYILLFGIFCLGLINYSFADTVGNFTSESEITSIDFSETSLVEFDFSGDFYVCIVSSDYPYYLYYAGQGTMGVNSSYYCYPVFLSAGEQFEFYTDNSEVYSKSISGVIYYSSSPITYNTPVCDCPVCESTFSTLFVNGTQITGSSNIYISTPDHFEYTPTYYTGYMDLDIENVGDPDYIENMLAIQTYRPTSDEFAVSFVGGLTLIMPYILITLFVLFIWRIIRKVFK